MKHNVVLDVICFEMYKVQEIEICLMKRKQQDFLFCNKRVCNGKDRSSMYWPN